MANPRGPDDRIANDPYTAGMTGVPPRSPQQLDADLQPDPELDEGRSSTGRVAVFALGIAILLAAVFYGLNNSSRTDQAANPPPTQSAQTQPATSSGNKAPGATTGAATNRPATPTQQGGSNVNQSAPSPAGQNNDTH